MAGVPAGARSQETRPMHEHNVTDPLQPADQASMHNDVIVVGGGQAGLAIGYYLASEGYDFVILEAAEQPAAAWRARWDSLRLFTSARYSSLPGLVFPGDPDS